MAKVHALFPTDDYLLGIESYFGVCLKSTTGEPTGVMSVMSRSPMPDTHQAENTPGIFAARASELERRKWERALHDSEPGTALSSPRRRT